jgi:DNA helicase IV
LSQVKSITDSPSPSNSAPETRGNRENANPQPPAASPAPRPAGDEEAAAETARQAEVAREQAYVTMLYDRLDTLRTATRQRLSDVHLGPTAENDQAWAERDMFAREYRDRAAELDAAERNLCFGRLDFDDADRFYIGRLGLRSDEHDTLLVDWRARAAEPFYRATPKERRGVTRRRHLHTSGRRVTGLDDDVLDLTVFDQAGVDESRLTGEAALLASLHKHRTGRMGDIVATIQADQDRIIREDPGGILVVEGGPGTGKTVVALHRAAYLLYTHRKRLARRGVLVLGPNAAFLRYIDEVLPSLGENDVVLATASDLFPGAGARGTDTPEAARVKGSAAMADVLAAAVAGLRQAPSAAVDIRIDGAVYRLTPRICGLARTEAGQRVDDETGEPLPHNTARRVFITEVVRLLDRQRARDLGVEPGEAEDLRELAADPALRGVLDVLWPEADPRQLLARLYADPGRLGLGDAERAAIARDEPGQWTPADIPLLDELAELIGPGAADLREARLAGIEDEAERAAQLEYADQLVTKLVSDEAIVVPKLEHDTFVEWIAGRNALADAPAGSLAERALRDRTWAYGHVIVDEAQELSAMEWRMVLRRCPATSMTVVGDLSQTAAPGGADSWAQVFDELAPRRWRTARLTLNYRTPLPIMSLATVLLPPGAHPPEAVRDSGERPWHVSGEPGELPALLPELVRRETELIGAGRVAVIAPPARAADAAAALRLEPGPDPDAPVTVLSPAQSKGLEFDAVIIVDPAGIEEASPRGRADLYVALTRSTRRLGLVGTLPHELAAKLEHQRPAAEPAEVVPG